MRWIGGAWTFYRDAFLRGFCTRITLLGILTLALAMSAGRVGVAFGVPLLFWHKDVGKQAFVGVVLAVLVAGILLVSYLIDTHRRRLWRELLPDDPGAAVASYVGGILVSYFATVIAVIAILSGFAALARRMNNFPAPNVVPEPSADQLPFPYALVAGGLIGMAVAAAMLFAIPAVPGCRPALDRFGRAALATTRWLKLLLVGRSSMARAEELRDHPPDETYLHAVAALLFAFSFGVFVALAADEHGRFASPAVSVCLLLTALTAAYGFLVYHFPAAVTIVILLLGLGLTVGGLPADKYRYPGLTEFYDGRRPELNHRESSATLLNVATMDRPRRPLVVVCASGGGIRAAGWTAAVLQQLEEAFGERGIDFPAHVRLMTGASGGMVAAAYYAATLHPPAVSDSLGTYYAHSGGPPLKHRHSRTDDKGNPVALRPDEIVSGVMQDGLSSIVHRGIYGDLPALFSFRPHADDRGRALEAAWSENMHRALDVPFQALRDGERDGWRPSLIFSPMLVEDGRRLLISNLDLEQVAQAQGNALVGGAVPAGDLKEGRVFSRSAVELFRLYGNRPEFRLSTAARMSASFPLVSPAVGLPTAPARRVVDAGYYDNFGVSLAAAWLFTHRQWVAEHTSGVVLIQIRDGSSEQFRTLERQQIFPPPSPLGRSLEGFVIPLEGVLTVREAAAAFRNDEMLEQLSQTLQQAGRARNQRPDFFTTVTFEYGGQAALSWYLTAEEQESIRQWAEQLRPAAPQSEKEARRDSVANMAARQAPPAAKEELKLQSQRQETTIERLLTWWEGR